MHKDMKTKFFLLILPAILLFACSPMTKTQYIHQYDDFMTTVKEEHKDFDESDWEKSDEEFRMLVEEYYPEFEEEMTEEEKVHFWTQAFTYQIYHHKDEVLDHLEKNKEVYTQMMEENAEFIADISDEFAEEILPELEKSLPELRRLSRDFVDRLEEKGTLDRMKNSLEKLEKRMQELGEKIEE